MISYTQRWVYGELHSAFVSVAMQKLSVHLVKLETCYEICLPALRSTFKG